MDSTIIDIMQECTERSLAETIAFPEIVGKPMGSVEAYVEWFPQAI